MSNFDVCASVFCVLRVPFEGKLKGKPTFSASPLKKESGTYLGRAVFSRSVGRTRQHEKVSESHVSERGCQLTLWGKPPTTNSG